MGRVTSASVNYDNLLTVVVEGRIQQQMRHGSKVTWGEEIALEGNRAAKSVHHRPDGVLYVIATDGSLWIRQPVGGSRDAREHSWLKVELPE